MQTALIIFGMVLIAIGAIVFVWPPGDTVTPQGVSGEIAKVLEQLNALLDKFDKRYRPGLVLMLVGLALVGAGIYWETVDTRNAASEARPKPLVAPVTSTR